MVWAMEQRDWRIGELAAAAGVSVRALRHYDRLGLLVPSDRTSGGHRVYSAADVRRLYRLLALRSLGVRLDDAGPLLDGGQGHGLAELTRAQLDRVAADRERLDALETRLHRLLEVIAAHGDAPDSDYLEAMEAMTTMEHYYTPEQLEQLDERRRELGSDGMERAQREWAELIADAKAHRDRGTDPHDPAMQAIAERWDALIAQFTGGDPGIRESLGRLYADQGAEQASRGMVDPELMAYVGRARDARS
jgi:MerR family transcriptional regulator, thiopeptide resistance regulator